MRRPRPLLLAAVLLAGCAPRPAVITAVLAPDPATPAPVGAAVSRDGARWVEQTLARLTLREKVGQLLVPRIPGDYVAENSEGFERIRRWVVDQKVGGVIITIGPPLEMAAKLNALQRLADVPLLVTADMEHGPGQILDAGVILPYGIDNGGATRFPPLMALGATGDERLAYELGRITAIEGRAAGVHVAFAPVVDVNNNPSNPIINVRSYGADPQLVARMARAHIRGLQEHGMLATAKHFPGHGDTGRDSHIAPLVIDVDRARADSVELVPFRAAVDEGVAAVMSAHIAFPALTGDSLPATLNPRLLEGLLRRDFGFQGLIFTDALDMGAIVKAFSNEAAPVLAIRAGADMLLQVMPNDVPTVIDAVVSAVEEGRISEARIDESVRRVLRAKARLGLDTNRVVELERVNDLLATTAHTTLAQDAADRSITLVRDADRLVPLRATRVLSIVYSDDYDPWAGRTLQRTLAASMPDLRTAQLDRRSDAAALAAVAARADSADVVLFSPFIRVSAGKAGLALPEPVAAMVTTLAQRRPVVVASFGNPYLIAQLPDVQAYLVAWGQWEAPQRAAARALTGAIPISGTLPIALPPEYPIGHGLRRGTGSTP
jgi:beta-N-acetylhexosaminidase